MKHFRKGNPRCNDVVDLLSAFWGVRMGLEMVLSHTVLSCFNMSPLRAIRTYFKPRSVIFLLLDQVLILVKGLDLKPIFSTP